MSNYETNKPNKDELYFKSGTFEIYCANRTLETR